MQRSVGLTAASARLPAPLLHILARLYVTVTCLPCNIYLRRKTHLYIKLQQSYPPVIRRRPANQELPMNSGEQSVSRAETLAVVYLVAPLFIFFAYFIRLEIAIPACALVALQIYQIIRRTAWRQPLASCWMYVYFSALAALWIALSIGVGSLQNSDWFKHYSVLNFLAQNTWPSHADITGLGDAVIRYSIGWYLIPALVLKITGAEIQTLALTAGAARGGGRRGGRRPGRGGARRGAGGAAPGGGGGGG